ncbi:MAG TPA: prolipoprotein diacylglyceryl transferase family protein [Humisphaera sp.]
MLQELFRIPYFDVPVSSYGLMMMLGFLGAIVLARFLARRSRIDPEIFVNAALIALVSGIGGARLSHVLENLPQFSRERVAVYPGPPGLATMGTAPQAGEYVLSKVSADGTRTPVQTFRLAEKDPLGFAPTLGGGEVAVAGKDQKPLEPDPAAKYAWDRSIPFSEGFLAAVNIRSGGLTFYGGFILAFVCTLGYAIAKGMPVKRGMDIVAPCVMIGLGFGRVGCFLNGCCEGALCELPTPVAVQYPYHSNPYIRHFQERTLDPTQVPPPDAQRLSVDGQPVAMSAEQIAADPRLAQAPQLRNETLAQVATLHSRRVFNAQLASTVTAFMIAVLLVGYYTLPHAPGRVMALMLMVESPTRFILEMMRAEPAFVGPHSPNGTLAWLPFDLSYSMFLSVWLFALGVALWVAFKGPPDDMTKPELPAGAKLVTA